MPPRTPITNNIRALRFHQSEMTQQELADRIGVSRQTLNAIEGGKYSPSLEVAFRIARVFDKPLEEVFRFDEPLPR
ncbi:MAG: helix-turn-helix transcriptional regulator [Planctomycetota bacterium]|nr:helix-turn-helix transcriptional regulator [Planctomycetota bacterium]